VRYCLTFKSERKRLLAYVDSPPPTFIVPMHKKKYRSLAIFAKRGVLADESYNWDVLQVYIEDLQSTVRLLILFIAAGESLLLYRPSALRFSLANCLLFQTLLSYPNLFPASWSFCLLLILLSTYSVPAEDKRLDHHLARRPSLLELFAALAFNRQPARLEYVPPGGATAARPAQTASVTPSVGLDRKPRPEPLTVDQAKHWILDDFQSTTVAYWEELILGHFKTDAPKEATLKFQKELVAAEVAAFIDEGDDSPEERLAKRRAREKAVAKVGLVDRINPLAKYLGPVQVGLAKAVPKVRAVRNVIFWNDRVVSFYLALLLLLATFALALVPWGLVIQYGARLGGLALFGPHMYLLGRWIDKRRAEERAAEEKYQAASGKEKRKMLDDYREELMKAARSEVKEAQIRLAPKSERSARRQAYLEGSAYVFLNSHTRVNANVKYVAAAEVHRSTVQPVPTLPARSDAAGEVGRQEGRGTRWGRMFPKVKESPRDLV